jgi:hypothetical protein
MNSYEYARQLKKIADYIFSRPEFEVDSTPSAYLGHYWEREKFITMAKALGGVEKDYSGSELKIIKTIGEARLWASIARDKVCRKVQEAKWECEPLLSVEEVEQLGTEEEVPF